MVESLFSSDSKTTTTYQPSPQQSALIDLIMPTAEYYAKNTPELYPGSSIAPFNPTQKTAQNMALSTANNFLQPFVQQTAGAHGELQGATLPAATGGLEGLLEPLNGAYQNAGDFLLSGAALDPNTNPALAATIDAAIRPLTESLQQDILPSVRSGAITSGQYGGSRQGLLEARAYNDYMRNAGDVAANIASKGYTAGLGAMGSAFGDVGSSGASAVGQALDAVSKSLFAAPDIAGLSLFPSRVYEGVGGQQYALQQAQLSEDAQKFMSEQLLPFLMAQDIAGLASGLPGGSATGKATEQPSLAQIVLGLGSTAAGLPIWGS